MSPFEIAQNVGNAFGKAQQRQSDISAIDEILLKANASGRQEDVNQAMSQILNRVSPERQQGALAILQNKQQMIQQQIEEQKKQESARKKGQAYKTQGLDESTQFLPDSVQAQILKNKQAQDAYNQITGKNNTFSQEGNDSVNPPNEQNTSSQKSSNALNANKNFSFPNDEELLQLSSVPQYAKYAEQGLKLNQENRKLNLDIHKESQSYDDELNKQLKVAKNQISTVKDVAKAIQSGNVTPTSIANILKDLGKIGNKVAEAFLNKDQAKLQAAIPSLLEGWKDIFGVRLSDADLKLLQDKLPSIGKSPEANSAILKVLNKYAEMNLLRGRIADEIKMANGGYRPLGFANQVEKRFDELTKEVLIINPANGKKIPIPAYKVQDALKGGGRLASEEE